MPKENFIEAPNSCRDSCPLCMVPGASLFHQDRNKRTTRPYYRCENCRLVFVPSAYFLSEKEEKAEYDLHENQLDDPGYKRFLNRFWQPVKSRLRIDRTDKPSVLDFGCGPGPALAEMMAADGCQVALYDHFYFRDESVLKVNHYDLVTSTEVFEHLHDPKGTLEKCISLVRPGGSLGLMTKLVTEQSAFTQWHYKNDLTHVIFFSRETFHWIAQEYRLTLEFADKDVILFDKPLTGSR